MVVVGQNDNRPRFPHFRQVRVSPKVTPIDLANFRRCKDAGLNARWFVGRIEISHYQTNRAAIYSSYQEMAAGLEPRRLWRTPPVRDPPAA
jgi:hypothetical protein